MAAEFEYVPASFGPDDGPDTARAYGDKITLSHLLSDPTLIKLFTDWDAEGGNLGYNTPTMGEHRPEPGIYYVRRCEVVNRLDPVVWSVDISPVNKLGDEPDFTSDQKPPTLTRKIPTKSANGTPQPGYYLIVREQLQISVINLKAEDPEDRVDKIAPDYIPRPFRDYPQAYIEMRKPR